MSGEATEVETAVFIYFRAAAFQRLILGSTFTQAEPFAGREALSYSFVAFSLRISCMTLNHPLRYAFSLGYVLGMISVCFSTAPVARGAAPDNGHEPIVIGLQLYSLRAQMAKDVDAPLAEVETWGVSDVELGGLFKLTAEQFRAELDKHHLHASGIHYQWGQFATDIDGIIRDAKILGCQYVTLPWIPHRGDFTADDARQAADKFNEWGKKLADAGLHFTYHPHGYEFRSYQDGTLFDLLASLTRPEYANFELDVFWAYHGGADPIKLMRKYPNRFPLLHLKDMDKSVKVPNTTGHENIENDVALGAGQMDIAGIVREGEAIGVKHFYIEDESSRSERQIQQSIQFLRSLDKK